MLDHVEVLTEDEGPDTLAELVVAKLIASCRAVLAWSYRHDGEIERIVGREEGLGREPTGQGRRNVAGDVVLEAKLGSSVPSDVRSLEHMVVGYQQVRGYQRPGSERLIDFPRPRDVALRRHTGALQRDTSNRGCGASSTMTSATGSNTLLAAAAIDAGDRPKILGATLAG